jgi:hypothetical protein
LGGPPRRRGVFPDRQTWTSSAPSDAIGEIKGNFSSTAGEAKRAFCMGIFFVSSKLEVGVAGKNTIVGTIVPFWN